VVSAYAWGFAVGYVVAKIIDMVKEIWAAKREANRKIAEARARVRGES
jgi:hypothetical protein